MQYQDSLAIYDVIINTIAGTKKVIFAHIINNNNDIYIVQVV